LDTLEDDGDDWSSEFQKKFIEGAPNETKVGEGKQKERRETERKNDSRFTGVYQRDENTAKSHFLQVMLLIGG